METLLAAPDFRPPSPQQRFSLDEGSAIATVRRHALQAAEWSGFSEVRAGELAIVVTELATNLVKHAGRGEILLRSVRHRTRSQAESNNIEVIALDRGPGIRDIENSLRDGISTSGTAGSGLGAIRRLSSEFDVYSQPGRGSAFFVRLAAAPSPQSPQPTTEAQVGLQLGLQLGVVSVPKPGEDICGDAWFFEERDDGAVLAVADGLGHGPEAAVAARATLSALADLTLRSPARQLQRAHQLARPTRGAAVAFAALNRERNAIQYAGLGNIAGHVCCVGANDGGTEVTRRHLISQNGIVGHNLRTAREMMTEWPPHATIILHSDGLSTGWDLAAYPRLLQAHPALIAAVLYRDFNRGSDDATIVALKHSG